MGYYLWLDLLKYSFPSTIYSIASVFQGSMVILTNKLKLYKTQAQVLYDKHIKNIDNNPPKKNNEDSTNNHHSNNPMKNKLEVQLGERFKPNDEIEVQIQQEEIHEEKLDN